jgi:peptidoglycan-N-acetylglucosamine deacetylase
MNILQKVRNRLYYTIADFIIKKKSIPSPNINKNRKYLFLYFDYEREFCGHKTNINDTLTKNILDVLDFYHIETTWFSVGKIFEKYPEIIKDIFERGHELGSHTYNHLNPMISKKEMLIDDFKKFNKASKSYSCIYGFHSPNGMWNLSITNLLKEYSFKYDLIRKKDYYTKSPVICKLFFGKYQWIRLNAVGDDWHLYGKNLDKTMALNHFIDCYNKIQPGNVTGIGFHPWLLLSCDDYFCAFKDFIEYLNKQSNLTIKTAYSYVKDYEIKK